MLCPAHGSLAAPESFGHLLCAGLESASAGQVSGCSVTWLHASKWPHALCELWTQGVTGMLLGRKWPEGAGTPGSPPNLPEAAEGEEEGEEEGGEGGGGHR